MNTIRRSLRPLLALAASTLIAATLTACGSSGSDDATYAPAAYGQQVGNAYDCYYIDDVDEVTALGTGLIAKGLCPHNSVPTVMPLYWEEEYWAYYSSPAYYGTYMPARYRSHYTSVTIVHFSSTYKTQIAAASSRAVYKSSSGQRVTGTSKVKFGTGTSQSVHGGGTRGGCAESLTVVQSRSGSSGSSVSHGGGTRSGTSSGSKSGSGSRGGC